MLHNGKSKNRFECNCLDVLYDISKCWAKCFFFEYVPKNLTKARSLIRYDNYSLKQPAFQ